MEIVPAETLAPPESYSRGFGQDDRALVLHAGRVRAWGEAPDGITWEIGVHAGRRPLLRLDGDRYLAH